MIAERLATAIRVKPDSHRRWGPKVRLYADKVVAVALANKMARIIWALLTKGGTYRGLDGANSTAGGRCHGN